MNIQVFTHDVMSSGKYILISIFNKTYIFDKDSKKMIKGIKMKDSFVLNGSIYNTTLFYTCGDIYKVELNMLK